MAVKASRKLKVYEQRGHNYKSIPAIHLQGQWLKEMGFDVGNFIQVKYEDGKLIIALDEERENLLKLREIFMAEKGNELQKAFDEEREKKFSQFVAEQKVGYGV